MRPERRTLSQAITEALLDRIRSGEFRPGDRLPTEKDLMGQYEVGRNAARESIQGLVAMGLVDVRPGRGATLIAVEGPGIDTSTVSALLDDKAIEDLNELWRLVEVETAARAAERATDEDVNELRSCLTRLRRARQRGGSVSAADDELHAAIARASHNSAFATVLDAVADRIRHARALAERVLGAIDRAAAEHEELVDAIEAHDRQRAADVMRRHIDGTIEAIRAGAVTTPAD